ncbi:PAS domain S-box protein [Flagellimonas lutimaris]|uniref:histidine kinase n=1 Tax=Flagellimonas lutimaris TaxID=475082 RepID=A0A3A1NEF2_9FLAO|nr:PAS domain S-box protein [Allomuricauda lutimaris]RIV37704.1 PAS domain S-box protein [Allomuricauda lutimaris]
MWTTKIDVLEPPVLNYNKAMNHKLSENEDYVFDFSPLPMWLYDVSTLKIIKVNQAALVQYGYSKKEFLLLTMVSLFPKNALRMLDSSLGDGTGTQGLVMLDKELSVLHRKKDGTVFPVRMKRSRLNREGKQYEVVLAISDGERSILERRISNQNRIFQCIADVNNNFARNPNWLKALDVCFTIICEALKLQRAYFFQIDQRISTVYPEVFYSRVHVKSKLTAPDDRLLPFPLMQMIMASMQGGRKLEATKSYVDDEQIVNILEKRGVEKILAMPVFSRNVLKGFIYFESSQHGKVKSKEELFLMDVLTSNISHMIDKAELNLKARSIQESFDSVFRKTHGIMALIDSKGDYIYTSRGFKRELVDEMGMENEKNFFQNIFVEDRAAVTKKVQSIFTKNRVNIGVFRMCDGAGNTKWMEAVLTNHMNNPLINALAIEISDVTEVVLGDKRKKLLLSLSKMLGKNKNLKKGLYKSLTKIALNSKMEAGGVWLITKDQLVLNRYSAFGANDISVRNFVKQVPVKTIKKYNCQGEMHWKSDNCIYVEDIESFQSLIRVESDGIEKLKSVIGIPIVTAGKFIGCILLFSKYPRNMLFEECLMFRGLGHELGDLIKKKLIEEDYQSLLEYFSEPFCAIDLENGKIRHVNNAFANQLGFRRSNIQGRSLKDFIHESDARLLDKKIKRDGVKKMDCFNQIRMLTRDMKEKEFIIYHKVKINEGLVLALTRQKNGPPYCKRDLKLLNDRLMRVQKLANVGIWAYNFSSGLIEWGDEVYKIYGYDKDIFRPSVEKLIKIVHPDDRNFVIARLKDTERTNKELQFEHRIITADGIVRWVRQNVQLVLDTQGASLYFESITQDISELKREKLHLVKKNHGSPLVMNVGKQQIWEYDYAKNALVYSENSDDKGNKIVEEAFYKDNSWFSKVFPEDLNRVWAFYEQQLFSRDKQGGTIEYRMEMDDGRVAHLKDSIFIEKDDDGRPIQTVGMTLDITQDKQQLEIIEVQNKVIDEVVWSQSHVIRSPLTRIMSLIDLYRNPKSSEYVSTDKLHELIYDAVLDIDNEIQRIVNKLIKISLKHD